MKSKLESSDAQRKGSPAALAGETAHETLFQHGTPEENRKFAQEILAGETRTEVLSFKEWGRANGYDVDRVIHVSIDAPEKYGEYLKAAAESRIAELAKFKQYVHKRLDDFGVPSDPDPEHNKVHGCRIEGRLNFAFARAETAQAALTQAQQEQPTIAELRAERAAYAKLICDELGGDTTKPNVQKIRELRAQKSALMEALLQLMEAIANAKDDPKEYLRNMSKAVQEAARVYEQVKENGK